MYYYYKLKYIFYTFQIDFCDGKAELSRNISLYYQCWIDLSYLICHFKYKQYFYDSFFIESLKEQCL